ncbi:MAG: hypothetical protein ACRD01_08315 [Terriglobales bacterium]
MLMLAKKFPSAFLVVAALKERLGDSEKGIVKNLASSCETPLAGGGVRPRVIVLTGAELFDMWGIEDAWQARWGPKSEPVLRASRGAGLIDLSELAAITQQLFLAPEAPTAPPLPSASASANPTITFSDRLW